jgi:hypothetical protein
VGGWQVIAVESFHSPIVLSCCELCIAKYTSMQSIAQAACRMVNAGGEGKYSDGLSDTDELNA